MTSTEASQSGTHVDADGDRPAPPVASATPAETASEFVVTKQHRRFAEFCDAVRRDRYIGLCHGAPGAGKTLSARHYSSWDTIGAAVRSYRFYEGVAPAAAIEARTIFYTPTVHNTPRTIDKDLSWLHTRFSWAVETALHSDRRPPDLIQRNGPYAELLIVDEADRLKTPELEALRDHHDRTGIGSVTTPRTGGTRPRPTSVHPAARPDRRSSRAPTVAERPRPSRPDGWTAPEAPSALRGTSRWPGGRIGADRTGPGSRRPRGRRRLPRAAHYRSSPADVVACRAPNAQASTSRAMTIQAAR